jgi:hypothetical protein
MMTFKRIRDLNLLFLLTSTTSLCQERVSQEYITFGNLLKNPIEIEVIEDGSKVDFFAKNTSFHPYTVTIEFKTLDNLSPNDRILKTIARPGQNRIRSFTITDPQIPHRYIYSLKYSMGDQYSKIDKDYPYVVPIGKSNKAIRIINNAFSCQVLDTVFAIRKGIVTSAPIDQNQYDRIYDNSVEVRHNDGSIGIYKHVRLINNLSVGNVILPYQPIGILEVQYLQIELLQLSKTGQLSSIPIKYALEGSFNLSLNQLNGLIPNHPKLVIEQEMTKMEKRKYQMKK